MTEATYTQLLQQPRPERLACLWATMSPQSRAECWKHLGVNGRADVIAACFDAVPEPS